jgi:hypothetical protein
VKDIGYGVEWECPLCGLRIHCHTTTKALVTLQHKRMHVRRNRMPWNELVARELAKEST